MKNEPTTAVIEDKVVISKINILCNGVKTFRKSSPYKIHDEDDNHVQLINRNGVISQFIPKESVEIITGNQ
jgi:hypothetical protein